VNAAHFHLLLNHLPVVGTLFGLGLLLWAMVSRNAEMKKGALGLLVLAALTALPTYLTGEPAEELVAPLAGVSQPAIEEHEEAAEVSAIAAGLMGASALLALWSGRSRRKVPAVLGVIVLILAVVTAGLMARTANLGGRIHHIEVRSSER
jgi:uncharacterized membrane protein